MATKVSARIIAHKLVEIDLEEVYKETGVKLTSKKAIKDYLWDTHGPTWGSAEVTIDDIIKTKDAPPAIKKGKGSY